MPEVAEARAPYVRFEKRPVEDRAASIENGHYTTKDVDFALITPAGSKDCVERIVEEWFEMLKTEVRQGRFPAEWLKHYQFLHSEWQAGNELPVNGTPIKTWPVLSPSQRENLIAWKVLTVEDLAVANEEVLRRMGMGGRTLKQQAIDYLSSASGSGKVSAEIGALRIQLEQLAAANAQLLEANISLKAKVQEPVSVVSLPEEDDLFADEPPPRPTLKRL